MNVAEFSSGEFSDMLLRDVEEKGLRIIVIDTLSGYLSAMSDEKDMTIQLHQLLVNLAHREVTTLLTVEQQGVFGEKTVGPKSVSYLADAILLLRFFEHRGQIRRAISVVKKRRGVHEFTIRELTFSTREGVSIGEPLAEVHGVLTGVPTLDT